MIYKIGDKVFIKYPEMVNVKSVFLNILKDTTRIATISRIKDDFFQCEYHPHWEPINFISGLSFDYLKEVEFSDNGNRWVKDVFHGYVFGADYPYKTKNNFFKFARPIKNESNLIEKCEFLIMEYEKKLKQTLSFSQIYYYRGKISAYKTIIELIQKT